MAPYRKSISCYWAIRNRSTNFHDFLPFGFETGRISLMKSSRRVLVKVVLFQLRGRDHPQDDATSNFFPDSERPLKGFQMRYHLFQKFFGKMVEIKEMSFPFTRGMILMFGNCRLICTLSFSIYSSTG